MTHHINTAQAGEEGDYVWVSLHFESAATEYDRIHIVCQKSAHEEDERHGTKGIYFERLHQAQAGYGLATRILVSASAVELKLTADGLTQLELPGSLELLWSPAIEGYDVARQHFAKMRSHEYGKIVQIA